MRILITRPSDRAGPLKDKLKELGHEVMLAPLLKISHLDFEIPEAPLQGVIFTSVQGVQGAKNRSGLKIFPAFTVGSKTAAAASAAGFETIHNAEGDSEALFELVVKTCKPGKGLLLHLAGENTAGDLVKRLKKKGLEAEHKRVYRAIAAESLPSSVIEKFGKFGIDGVLFFSTRTATIFSKIAKEKELTGLLGKVEAYCLSQNIASEAEKLLWKKVHFSPLPTEQSLIDLLQAQAR